jgi:epoxyqueuosine reductase
MKFNGTLRSIVNMWGAAFCGVANLSLAKKAIFDQGGELVADYPSAISVGIALSHPIVDQLPHRAERAVAVSYRHEYDVVNQRLDLIASHVSSFIQQQGFRAFPVPSAKRIDDQRICAVFSHKLAAHLAGLGWIGKSCLLITPEVGPRIRWVSVLTDAPLTVTGEPMEERCGTCQKCVEICPVQAFTGRSFREQESREVRYDASKCDRYFEKMKEKKPGLEVCGLCLYVCPYGRRNPIGDDASGDQAISPR